MDEIIDTDISFGANAGLPNLSVLSGCMFQIFGCLTGGSLSKIILIFWFFWEKRFQEHLKDHLLNQMFTTNWILEKYQISGIIYRKFKLLHVELEINHGYECSGLSLWIYTEISKIPFVRKMIPVNAVKQALF